MRKTQIAVINWRDKVFECDVVNDAADTVLASGYTVPFTTQKTASKFKALADAAVVVKPDARIAELPTRKTALRNQIVAINDQILRLQETLT